MSSADPPPENTSDAEAPEVAEMPEEVEPPDEVIADKQKRRGSWSSSSSEESDAERDEPMLTELDDHFTLPVRSSYVRSRKKTNAVRVYSTGFGQQVVIEQSGGKTEVKKMDDITAGHQLLNSVYAVVSALFAGFLFVFFLQVLLFLVLDLSIEAGATSGDSNLHLGNMLGVILAIIAFSHYFAEALVIATQFIYDTWCDHPLSKSFILSKKKGGHVFIEWAFLTAFLLIPAVVAIFTLFIGLEDFWFYTAITWFTAVMIFYLVFALNVVYYEVRSAFAFVANRFPDDNDSFFHVTKRCILLRQRRNYGGDTVSSYLARNVFTDSEDTEKKNNVYEKSKQTRWSFWTWLTRNLMPEFLFQNLKEPKTIYTIPDVEDYRPFLTRKNWSLERIFCRPSRSRYITLVSGSGSLTPGQLRSSIYCSVLGGIMIPFSIVAFLVWLAAPWKMILFFLAIVFLASYSAIKNAYDMSKLGRDLITVQNKKASKIASGGTNERSEAVYLVSSIERITEATACFCWLSFLSEQGLFFIWPSITLLRINWNIGLLFCIVSIASNIRWYINAVTAIEETGKMDLVNGDTEAEKWENKARLNEIVTKISTSDKSYRFWRVMLTSLGFIFVALMISTNEGDGVVQANKEAFTYLPKQYYYPGAKADMLYPSCTMASVESGFGNQSTMLDYAWLANTAYRPKDNITEFDLDVWYNFTDDVVIDEQPIVDEFRARNEDSAVTFKLISIPGPSEGERTAVILIRGTVNQWDALADAQLWSAAALMQWLRYVIPIGELWTPIFNELVSWMNSLAKTSLDKIAFYKLTTKFANELKSNPNFAAVQVTGHSLGGGLSLITGAQAKIPAIGLSAPNTLISGGSFDPVVTEDDLNRYTFNIIPNQDMVPKLDDVAANYQYINCTKPVQTGFIECHFGIQSLCEIQYTCGSGNRPVLCECFKTIGYPRPSVREGFADEMDDFCVGVV